MSDIVSDRTKSTHLWDHGHTPEDVACCCVTGIKWSFKSTSNVCERSFMRPDDETLRSQLLTTWWRQWFTLNVWRAARVTCCVFPELSCVCPPGEVHGQAGAQAGLQDRGVLRQLRGAIHWHQPVHPQQTGADPEGQGLHLRDHNRLRTVSRRDWWYTCTRPLLCDGGPDAGGPVLQNCPVKLEKGTTCVTFDTSAWD